MSRAIDGAVLTEWISGECKSPSCPKNESAFGMRIMEHIERMPTIEPERKVGTWEPVDEIPSIRKRFKRYCCSNCKKEGFDTWNYCPECGQRNREVEEPEDIPMEYFESGGR